MHKKSPRVVPGADIKMGWLSSVEILIDVLALAEPPDEQKLSGDGVGTFVIKLVVVLKSLLSLRGEETRASPSHAEIIHLLILLRIM